MSTNKEALNGRSRRPCHTASTRRRPDLYADHGCRSTFQPGDQKPANTPAIRSEAVPGAKWNYSGGGYTIMQQALIDVTKEPFPKLLHDTVLAPIGMTQSTYEQPPTEV